MAVNLTWSESNGGAAISGALEHGDVPNGSSSNEKEVFLRHDRSHEITDAKLFIRAVSSGYTGGFTAASDLAEMLAWADATTSDGFGGLLINWNATGSYPSADWPSSSNKSPTNGVAIRTGVGDSEANAITIPTVAGTSPAGTIATGSSPNVRWKFRFDVPTDEDTIGIRQVEAIISFNFTS